MLRSLALTSLAFLLLLVTACGEPEPDGPNTVTFRGSVASQFAPTLFHADAWVVVDVHGGDLLETTTDANGEFSVEVPEGSTLTVTAGAEGSAPVTLVGIDSARPGSLDLYLMPFDQTQLPGETWSVSVTVDNLPAGATHVFVYGGDQGGSAFAPISDPTQPATVNFDTFVLDGLDEVGFTLGALNGTTAEFFDAVALVVRRADADKTYSLSMPGVAPTVLQITTNRPVIDGSPFDTFNSRFTYVMGQVRVNDPPAFNTGAVLGFTTTATDTGTGYALDVPYVVTADHPAFAQVYLSRDPSVPANGISLVQQAIEPGATSLTLEALDTPTVDTTVTWEPGASLSWPAVAGASSYLFAAISDGTLRWQISTLEPELAFPRFPEGFDLQRLNPGGGWRLQARQQDISYFDHPVEFDPTIDTFKVSVTAGGLVSF
ncbi:MAG: hypothetical protein P1V51_00455 [Deltaproteobacteria bacterium]|nr:hypothetical protein [Deltaproteobacteria bacterium]